MILLSIVYRNNYLYSQSPKKIHVNSAFSSVVSGNRGVNRRPIDFISFSEIT